MTRRLKTGLMTAALCVAAGSLMAHDRDDDRGRDKRRFAVSAELIGYQEVPSLSTVARGRFRAWVDTVDDSIHWKLSYDGLEGTVTQSHVHFGQMSVNGGISFFLCTNLGNGPVGTQTCPAGPAELEGIITPDLVIGPTATATSPGQGIEPGAFSEIAAAIRNGVAYANVHSSKWPAGEIRGQLRRD
ncbi:MAG TPA: CHRD domain-containing protein [Steroidobacteraceae bacterium]|nr:CHRD domain-containing protein [Steroidobacteraceae bacterium]